MNGNEGWLGFVELSLYYDFFGCWPLECEGVLIPEGAVNVDRDRVGAAANVVKCIFQCLGTQTVRRDVVIHAIVDDDVVSSYLCIHIHVGSCTVEQHFVGDVQDAVRIGEDRIAFAVLLTSMAG